MVVREILDKAGAASCCKTSGKRGLHVYVSLGQKYTFPQVKLAADILARLIHRQLPATTTLDSRPEKRQGRIYLDTTRNARGQAVARFLQFFTILAVQRRYRPALQNLDRLHLNELQERYVALDHKGGYRIQGASGSGKTVILIHRALRL